MTVNVLADRHHSGLLHSLQLLADRLGWTLYTPTGLAWWESWYWSFGRGTYNDDRLAQQFLRLEGPDGEFPDTPIRYVTLEEAKGMEWAYVIATAQDNQSGFHKFAKEMGAEYVVQCGNTGQQIFWHLDPLALVSSEVPIEGRGIVYHQEMDPIEYRPPTDQFSAASFVNCMPQMGRCWDLLNEAKGLGLPVSVYGIEGPDGNLKPLTTLLDRMASVGWGWHDKGQGDGFGHVIHSWAAIGRPLIGHGGHYARRMAGYFWQDMETCIDLDRHSVAEAVEIIRTMTPERHAEMCANIRRVFDREVDYEAEAAKIADFLRVPVPA